MNRWLKTILAGVGIAVASPSLTASAAPWIASGAVARGDFDDDGNVETVASSPESDGNKGAVYVVDGAAGTATRWTRDTIGLAGAGASAGDFFGAALAVGDFNGDDYDDLLIGVPGADDAGPNDSGVIHVIYGSKFGLTTTGDQVFHQDTTGIKGTAEADDQLGDALTTGDFDCDGYDDVVIGVPMEGISSASDAGAVQVLYGSSSGVSTVDDIWYQGTGGVNGGAETGDHFGAALVAGNFNGDSDSGKDCDDLAIGALDENIGSTSDAGLVYSLLGGTSGLSTTGDIALYQNVSGVEDTSEADDRFGLRLLSGDSDGDGYDDLAVAVPGDSCLTGHAEGRHVFLGTSTGLTVTGDALGCDTYRCVIDDDDDHYACHSFSPPVHASSAADTIAMFTGDDVVHAGAGADTVFGGFGDDVLFGSDGGDTFDAGAGLDIQIGGAGDDIFIIDADCEVLDGEVIDGGPGDDEIHSHMTRAELLAAGLTIISADVVTLAEGDEDCVPYPFEEGPFAQPRVALTWDDVPDEDSVHTSTTTSTLDLSLENVSPDDVTIDLTFTLIVQGYSTETAPATITILAGKTKSHTLDLDDFVPSWADPDTVSSDLADLPTSAYLRTAGAIKIGTPVVETAFAPVLFGHLEDAGDTLKVYRSGAYHDTYLRLPNIFHRVKA